jgi:tRNA (guanine-N7-)-methyltransferase
MTVHPPVEAVPMLHPPPDAAQSPTESRIRPTRLPPDPVVVARQQAWLEALREKLAGWLPRDGRALVWEIGCGHGHFLTAYAAAHPAVFCVGVDTKAERVARAERKRERAGLANLRFVRAEARMFLAALPPSMTLAAVFVLFPDPWPKRRHHKHRLLGEDFFRALAARVGPGTLFCLRTDHEPYFREVAAVLTAHPDWRLAPDEAWPFEHTTVFQQRAAAHCSLMARRR